MAKRSEVLGALEGVGTGFSRMGQMMLERERFDTQKALEEEENERKRALHPSQLEAAQAGASLAGTQASEALATAEKRKGADAANQSLMAENEAAGWMVDPDDQGSIPTWKSELNALNRFRAKEGKPAMSVQEYVTAKKQEKFDRTKAQDAEKRAGEEHADKLKTSAADRTLTFAQAGKAGREANAPAKASELPIDVKTEVTGLAGKNAGKISIANQLRSYLTEFKAAKSQDDKVRVGRQMLKVLNSPEGADAIGVEEAKRLGDALEYNVFDIGAGLGLKTGKLHGRDLAGFENQVKSTVDAIDGAINANRQEVDRRLGRAPAAAPAQDLSDDDLDAQLRALGIDPVTGKRIGKGGASGAF